MFRALTLLAHSTRSKDINKSIADNKVLTNAMSAIGLPTDDVKSVLESGKFETEVRKNERRAFMIGMPSAPLFVINNKYSITGAQPYEVFLEALKKVINKNA